LLGTPVVFVGDPGTSRRSTREAASLDERSGKRAYRRSYRRAIRVFFELRVNGSRKWEDVKEMASTYPPWPFRETDPMQGTVSGLEGGQDGEAREAKIPF
jgi:hypothetical protein